MKPFSYLLTFLILILFFIGCENTQSPYQTIEDVVVRIPDVELIPGAGNAAMTVRYDGSYSYFRVTLNNVDRNPIIPNGTYNAWCLQMDLPINTGEEYTGVQLYSTERDAWLKKITYIVNNRTEYERTNPGLSWKDIQVAMWVLLETRGYTLSVLEQNLPSSVDGYNPQIVNNILNDVQKNGKDYVPRFGDKQIVMGNNGTPFPELPGQDIAFEVAWAWVMCGFSAIVDEDPLWGGIVWRIRYDFRFSLDGVLYLKGIEPDDDNPDTQVGTVQFRRTVDNGKVTELIITIGEQGWNINVVGVWYGKVDPVGDPNFELKIEDFVEYGFVGPTQTYIIDIESESYTVNDDIFIMVYAKGSSN